MILFNRLLFRLFCLLLLTPLFVSLSACRPEKSGQTSPDTTNQPAQTTTIAQTTTAILVTVDPLRWMVEQIGGEKVTVSVFVPAGREPETFAPTPRQMAQLAENRLFFRAGLACEVPLLAKLLSLAPGMKTIDLRTQLDMLADSHQHQEEHNAHNEHEEHEGHESHGEHETHGEQEETASCQGLDGLDPHFWMSPECVKISLQTITDELSQLQPDQADFFEENRQKTTARLTELQAMIQETVAALPHRVLLVYHPAYGYFCREFGLEQLSVEVDGKSPKASALAGLIKEIKEKGIKKIITQPEFSDSGIETLLSQNEMTAVVHSPLNPDYEANLRELNDFLKEIPLQNQNSQYNK